MKILHAYTFFKRVGGAQKVLVDIWDRLGGSVCSFDSFADIDPSYQIPENQHLKIGIIEILKIRGSIIISHHRLLTSLFVLVNRMLGAKNRIIHVAHNEFYNLSWLTIFPREIVAVSESVKKNICDFFEISPERVEVILNGISDSDVQKKEKELPQNIKIIYPARVCSVKQQVRVAEFFLELNLKNISIYFAGTGPDEAALLSLCEKNKNIYFLGQVSDLEMRFIEFEFLLLFSKKEGLPLSLIEALRSGLPAICNNVGGNREVVDESTGFVVESWDDLRILLTALDEGVDVNYPEKIHNSRVKYLALFPKRLMQEKYYRKVFLEEFRSAGD